MEAQHQQQISITGEQLRIGRKSHTLDRLAAQLCGRPGFWFFFFLIQVLFKPSQTFLPHLGGLPVFAGSRSNVKPSCEMTGTSCFPSHPRPRRATSPGYLPYGLMNKNQGAPEDTEAPVQWRIQRPGSHPSQFPHFFHIFLFLPAATKMADVPWPGVSTTFLLLCDPASQLQDCNNRSESYSSQKGSSP